MKSFLICAACCWLTLFMPGEAAAREAALPATLADTGFRRSLLEFAPQYPLWSDGADKKRWVSLPPGTSIDARNPDAWVFPRGTRLWKEFSHGGRPIETRYVELSADGRWRFATYVWNEAGTAAVLAPERGVRLQVPGAPRGKYSVPGRGDCLACHNSAPVPVLGLTAVQLSAPMLKSMAERGWLRNLPRRMLAQPPKPPSLDAAERAALGYLHGNCAHCHNTSRSRVPLALTLAQRSLDPDKARAEVLRSTVGQQGRYGQSDAVNAQAIIQPGQPERSLLLERMRSRQAHVQMPPLGTEDTDREALELIGRWISNMNHQKGESP